MKDLLHAAVIAASLVLGLISSDRAQAYYDRNYPTAVYERDAAEPGGGGYASTQYDAQAAAYAAYQERESEKIADRLEKYAGHGYLYAQYALGTLYDDGGCRKRDYAQAAKWYRDPALHGYPEAQYRLGVLYAKGLGVTQDYLEAAAWFRKAAVQGNAYAQYGLGLLYDNGRGVPQDDAEAFKWYSKAAAQGIPEAQNNLGTMYQEGRGVPEDAAIAAGWYEQAARQGNVSAVYNLESLDYGDRERKYPYRQTPGVY